MVDLKSLYQEVIIDHNKNPRNYGELKNPDIEVDGYNPLCGDHYIIYVKFDNDKVAQITFKGSGCAISKASASIMTTMVKGKTKLEALELFEIFHKLVKGENINSQDFEKLGRLEAFSEISEFPTRVKCAILPWHTLKNAIENKKQTVSTE